LELRLPDEDNGKREGRGAFIVVVGGAREDGDGRPTRCDQTLVDELARWPQKDGLSSAATEYRPMQVCSRAKAKLKG
jgi:hypothetical protein